MCGKAPLIFNITYMEELAFMQRGSHTLLMIDEQRWCKSLPQRLLVEIWDAPGSSDRELNQIGTARRREKDFPTLQDLLLPQ